MNLGWIVTFASECSTTPQISIASEGGSGTAVPDLSIEVDNIDEVYDRAVAAGFVVEYEPTTETLGVRRFYVRDPFGRLINVLSHAQLPAPSAALSCSGVEMAGHGRG